MQNVSMQPNLDALQAQQATAQTADVSAFNNQNIALEATPAADTLELSTQEQPKKKGGLGALLALVGATVAGIAIFKKIKTGKAVELDDLSKLKEHLASNKNFTGTVTGKVNKAGDTAKLVYKKGVLQQSTKLDKEGKEIFTKIYENTNGKLTKVTKKVADKADEITSFARGDDGKIAQISKKVGDADEVIKEIKPKAETPKVETPKAEAPKADAPKVDTPKADAPKADTPKVAPKQPVVFKSLDKRTKAWQKEGATIRQDNLKLLEQLDPKVVKRMPDSFLKQPLTAPTSFWWKQEGIDAIKEFTPDQMTKIMNNPYGPNSVSNLLTGCYNTKAEYNELLNYLRAMTK